MSYPPLNSSNHNNPPVLFELPEIRGLNAVCFICHEPTSVMHRDSLEMLCGTECLDTLLERFEAWKKEHSPPPDGTLALVAPNC